MIKDQAAELRALVHDFPAGTTADGEIDKQHRHRGAQTVEPNRPALVAVLGAREGVGATTAARHLVECLQQTGRSVSLVDSNHHSPNSQSPNSQSPTSRTNNQGAPERSIRQHSPRQPAEIVIADLSGDQRVSDARLLPHARRVVLVSTTDVVVLMDAYAKLKAHRQWLENSVVELIVNQENNPDRAQVTFERLERSCARFLGLDVELLGSIPTIGEDREQKLRQVGIAFLRRCR